MKELMKPVLDQVDFTKEDLGIVDSCFVSAVEDYIDDEGNKSIYITFFRPGDRKYIQTEVGDHGLVFITKPYDQDFSEEAKADSSKVTAKEVFEMEQKLKDSISSDFFDRGTHTDKDLIYYEAYSSVQQLRILLEEYDQGLRELAEELKEEAKRGRGGK